MTVGERIRERRRSLNMTQNELAKAIGVTYQLISNYEHGVVIDIPTSKIKLMASALRCDPLWLAEGVVPEEGLTVAQLRIIEKIKNATPEQVSMIKSYVDFVTK
jgi:transcriptional regulator with XRE-family HTH domain